jgi:hypothetical protein
MRGYRFADGARLLPDGRDSMIFLGSDGRRASAYCELWDAANGAERCIYSSSIKEWMPPHNDQPFTENDRKEVIMRISQFYNRSRIKYIVQ